MTGRGCSTNNKLFFTECENHVMLGEARAHFRNVYALSVFSRAQRRRILVFEDNFPLAASFAKGRSPSDGLNYYCRRRVHAAGAAAAGPNPESRL